MPIILYLVPPKSPLLTLALLLALFSLLLYPVWMFCSSEKHRWLKVAAISILGVAVVAFGVYVWPSSDAVSMVAAWVTARIFALWSMPWRWLMLGAAVGGYAVFILLKRRPQKCPYQWAHGLADEQVDRVSRDVELQLPWITEMKLTDEVPSITFRFPIFSNSLFDVAVDEQIKGRIYFEQKELVDLKIVRWPSDQIVYRGEGHFFIEQRLTEREAKLIATTEGKFHFHDLTVMIKESPNADGFPENQVR